MSTGQEKVVSASRVLAASPEDIFEFIADPAQQPRWDGNDNLGSAAEGQRVRAVGDVFTMTLTSPGKVRENHVVEFDEGRLLAWRPAEPGAEPPGHLWRWELEGLGPGLTRVTHTYDWTELTDPTRFDRARATTQARLLASVDRLAELVENQGEGRPAAADAAPVSLQLVQELYDQLDFHWTHAARPRLDTLTDEEYLWEPVAGAWSVRPRTDEAPASATHRVGAGKCLVEFGIPEPEPAPVTTIAWRLAHVIVGVLGERAHSHFGGPPAEYATWEYAGTAAEALAQLDAAYAAWSSGVRALTEEDLARPVGPAEGPWAAAPMLTLVLHIHREVIHHLAEVALLRDLWAHRGSARIEG